MFARVHLIHGFPEPLWYSIPATLSTSIHPNTLVRVPLRGTDTTALVISTHDHMPTNVTFAIKPILALEPFPHDTHYHTFIAQLAAYYQLEPRHFIKRVRHFVHHAQPEPTELEGDQSLAINTNAIQLTDEQQAICDFMRTHISTPAYTPTLLHGITGSGKTEVYKNLILHTLEQKRTALLLLPEVTLALQFQKLLAKQLPPHVMMHGFHSAASMKEKRLLWQRLIHQEPVLIIGVHLPILLPIAHLGLIVVDEEHEVGYQEKKHPKVNTKDAALWRAKIADIPILLGSATPSIASLHNAKTKGWHFFSLTQRFSGALPTIRTVLLTDKKQRRNFWISDALHKEIAIRLAKKEQTIIFLNRRGFSFFVQCKQCTHIFSCTDCSVSLTLHEGNILACHYCGKRMPKPACCPHCKTVDFINKGIGTQQIVTILEKMFPQARIGRADLDITAKKKSWQETLRMFEHQELDILVGTQTITKGFDFPGVTLVGIIWADLNVHFPIYNATETALQQLIQVAGRAGRHRPDGMVIVQTMSDHTLFNYLNERDYVHYCEQEMFTRQEVGYPPFIRLVELELKNSDEQCIEKEAAHLVAFLRTQNERLKTTVTILGPAKPPVAMIKKVFARKIYLKSTSMLALAKLFSTVDHTAFTSAIFFTPNPLS